MFKYLFFSLLLLMASCCIVRGDSGKPDSLRTALRKAISHNKNPADTLFINNLNKLANDYLASYPDSTLYFGQLAIQNARKIKYTKGIADGLLVTTNTYLSEAKYMQASKSLDEAIKLYATLNDATGVSTSYKIYGTLYTQKGDYEKSLQYLKKALAIKLQINDLAGTARIYQSMGNVYDNLGYPSTALDYYFKALNINTKLHKALTMSANYNNIGVVLQNMEIYPEALKYFNKALKTWQQMHSYGGISTAYQNIGEVLIAQHKYDDAINYLTQALAIAEKQDDKDGISSGYNDLGVAYLYKNQNAKALSYLEKALKIASDNQLDFNKATSFIDFALYYNTTADYKKAYDFALKAKALSTHLGSTVLRTNSAIEYIKALGGLKKYQEAFIAQREFDKMQAGFKKDESVQKFTSYNFQYNYADKQRQQAIEQKANVLLYQQKAHAQLLLNIIFITIIGAMLIIVGVYYRQKHKQVQINTRLAAKNREVITQKVNLDEQAATLNDLNKLKDRLIAILAHDLRSPLSTLRAMFSLLEDAAVTQQQFTEMLPDVLRKLDYTSDFLDTLLFWINSQMDNEDFCKNSFCIKKVVEIEMVNLNEQASLKGIDLVDHVPEDLKAMSDSNSIRIVIRNLITNAIKFSEKGDYVEISAHKQDTDVLIAVKDNGVGMTEEQRGRIFKNKVDSKIGTNNESGTGMGLLFCKDLVEKCSGKIWVESQEGVGTTFYFTLPFDKTAEQTAALVA